MDNQPRAALLYARLLVCLMVLTQLQPSGATEVQSFFQNIVYNVSDEGNFFRDRHLQEQHNYGLKCTVEPTDDGLHATVLQLQKFSKLIEYSLHFKTGNYSVNPLLVNQTQTYKSNLWARVGSSQGMTILNLAFNYDVLSLKTLSFGIEKLDIDLVEHPPGCVGRLSEAERIQVVMDIMLRDFETYGPIRVADGEAVLCHQVIQENNGTGKFTDRCCMQARDSIDIACFINPHNKYLNILDILLVSLSMIVFLFGLSFTPSWLYMSTMDHIPYYVKLKEPLYKTIVVTDREEVTDVQAEHVMYATTNFPNFFRIISDLPMEVVIPIKIDQYDIDVSFRKMLEENSVPVGIMSGIARAIFQCKLHELSPFEGCCNANVTGCINKGKLKWKDICSLFGRILFVLSIPFPFYIRLVFYYFFEYPEIISRIDAAANIGLVVDYEFRIMQFLTPTHPLYITMYVFYFAAGIRLAYTASGNTKPHIQTAIITAIHELKTKSKWLVVLGFIVNKFLWPFKKFGIYGIFVGLIYWPIVMPIIIIPSLLFSIPLVYIMVRILHNVYIKHPAQKLPAKTDRKPKTLIAKLKHMFNYGGIKRCKMYSKHPIMNLFFCLATFITIFAMMTMIAEVTRFMAEIMCFTVMGLIVNAAKVIKYGSMMFMLVLYSRECFNDVNCKYLKLNKALFNEIQRQLGNDIAEFTQLPEGLQENRGFKAVEASAQGEHEETDDLVTSPGSEKYFWDINDLILTIDKRDTPRMPKRLFDMVCQLKVAGCPGPVYKSLLMATGKFLFIILFLCFVFIVVMSFGEANNFSQSSQMIAAMVGGFLPLIINNLLKGATPQVETNLLSFKAKVGEVITQYHQLWPLIDFIFTVEEPPKSDDEEDEEGSDTESSKSSKSSKSQGKDDKDKDKNDKSKGEKDRVKFKDDKDKDKPKKDKGKDKKDKDKKDKDKSKDSKPEDEFWFTKTKEVDFEGITAQAQKLALQPAEGAKVDILIHLLHWQFAIGNSALNLKSPSMDDFLDVEAGGGGDGNNFLPGAISMTAGAIAADQLNSDYY